MTYLPMGNQPTEPEAGYSRPSRDEPRIVWILPFTSLAQLVQFPSGTLTVIPTIIIAAIIAVVAVPIAFGDQRVLFANGHVRATTPWLALLPVLYLGVRGSRRFDETQHGMKPFWAGLAIAALVGFLLFWGPEGIAALLL